MPADKGPIGPFILKPLPGENLASYRDSLNAMIRRGELNAVASGKAAGPGEASGTGVPDAGGPEKATPKTRKRTTSTLPVMGGKRAMKAYAVTEDELENLGLLSISSTVAFSIATFLGGFSLSVFTSIALSSGVKPETVGYWEGLASASAIVSATLVLVGCFLIYRGHSKIGKIKQETDHG